jgi:hypothetical protein
MRPRGIVPRAAADPGWAPASLAMERIVEAAKRKDYPLLIDSPSTLAVIIKPGS